jgi:hypothetical protein
MFSPFEHDAQNENGRESPQLQSSSGPWEGKQADDDITFGPGEALRTDAHNSHQQFLHPTKMPATAVT